MSEWIFLSHPLGSETPTFFTNPRVERESQTTVRKNGYSQELLTMLNHTGTHVDAPSHFVELGASVDTLSADKWVFENPVLIDVATESDHLVETDGLYSHRERLESADIVLLRTGFERYRERPEHWSLHNPGLSEQVALALIELCPKLRAVGVDLPSASAAQAMDDGAAFHQVWLGQSDRTPVIFEDLHLSEIHDARSLELVIALPIRLIRGDGAPCTVIGRIRRQQGGSSRA